MDVESVADGPALPELPRPSYETRRLSLGRAIAALAIGFVLAQLFGKIVGDIARGMLNARATEMSPWIVVPSMLASELTLLGVSLISPLVAALPVRRTLGLRSAPWQVFVAAAVGTFMLGPLGDQLMSVFAKLFPSLTLGVVPALHDLAKRLPLVVLWPTFALLPGLSEELLFRGVLQRALVRRWVAVIVSGSVFAMFHIDPVHVIGVLPLGLFLAWVAQRSSTSVTIVAHVVNNSVALFAIQSSAFDVGYGTDQPLPPGAVVGSALLFAGAAWVVLRSTSVPALDAHGTG